MRVENLYLLGGIYENNPEYVNLVKTFLDIEQRTIIGRKPDTVINLFISSNGGYVTTGLGLYSLLSNAITPIRTFNIGAVESMAFVIFLAGKDRYAYPNTRFHYHPSLGDTQEGVHLSNLECHLSSHRKLQTSINNIILDRTRISRFEVESILAGNKEMYWTAEESLDFGISHKIIHGGMKDFAPELEEWNPTPASSNPPCNEIMNYNEKI